ncbi:unnamed protein product [Arctogadus glacialis]
MKRRGARVQELLAGSDHHGVPAGWPGCGEGSNNLQEHRKQRVLIPKENETSLSARRASAVEGPPGSDPPSDTLPPPSSG